MKKSRWVQRDLEDQIKEEHEEIRKLVNQFPIIINPNKQQSFIMSTEQTTLPQIKVSEVLGLIRNGYVRYKKQNKGGGSIQEHYNLSANQIAELFKHEKLRGKKTQGASLKSFNVVDDAPDEEVLKFSKEQFRKKHKEGSNEATSTTGGDNLFS